MGTGTDPDIAPDEAEEAEPDQSPGRSPMDRLRKRYADLQREHYHDIDVPGYGGQLVARYVPFDDHGYKIARAAMPKGGDVSSQEIAGAVEQILTACHSLWFRNDEGALIPVDESERTSYLANPVRFDERLADILGFDYNNDNAQVVRDVFSVNGRLNVTALANHGTIIGTWLADVTRDTSEALAGE